MKSAKQLKEKYYDRFNRDPESIKFYQSPMWRKTRQMKLSRDPLCEACLQAGVTTAAVMVHHTVAVKKGTHNLELNFLVSLCQSCHNKIELEILKDAASS